MPTISEKEGGATRISASVPMAAAMQPYAGSPFGLRFPQPLPSGRSLSPVDIHFCAFVSVTGIVSPCRVWRLGIPALQIYVFYFIQQSVCLNLLSLPSLSSCMGRVPVGFLPVVALPCRISCCCAIDEAVRGHPSVSPSHWVWDGVHPTAAGHALMSCAWIEASGL